MKRVTVATLNLRKGEARWGERAPLLMEQLVELRPDIIGFQEVDLRLDQGNWLCRRFNDLIWEPGAPEYRIHHMASPRERVALEALAIMTHLPVLAHEGLDYLFRNRVAHRLRVDVNGLPLDFYNTHLHHEQVVGASEIRQEQVDKLLSWIRQRSRGVPRVVVGDFNAFPTTRPIAVMKKRFRSAYEATHGHEPPNTVWTPLRTAEVGWRPSVGMVVDYIFVSDGLQVRDACVAFDRTSLEDPTLCASDHFGLAATLEIG